ncbi:MAG: HAD family hydrolase [Hyphomonadaceae bacterium]
MCAGVSYADVDHGRRRTAYAGRSDQERKLERFEKVDTLILDKTGTLTQGKPAVVAIELGQGFEEPVVLALAASLENQSEHPLCPSDRRSGAAAGSAHDRSARF